jgi:hypothetical protein
VTRFVSLAALAALAACGVPTQGPWMDPGQDCMQCHAASGGYRQPNAPGWTLAGTVFASQRSVNYATDATIIVEDSTGTTLSIATNGSGNFYTAENMVPPFKVAMERNGKRIVMPDKAPDGACNHCHTNDGKDAVGQLFPP